MLQFLLLANLTATLLMTGLIWFVQIVHYPLFACVDQQSSCYCAYQKKHMALTSWVVVPPMLTELFTSVALVFYRPASISLSATIIGCCMVAGIWLSTFLLQVPQHQSLLGGFSQSHHRRLVATNWIRTFLWTLRSVLVIWIAAGLMVV